MHLLAFGFFPLSLIMRDHSHYDHVMQFDVTDCSFNIRVTCVDIPASWL